MSAFSSSATVSAFSPSLPSIDLPNRRRREEHHHHVSHQGGFRRTCTFSSVALRSSAYPLQVQHVVPEVTIPPEVTPENVTTHIIDSGAGPQDRQHLELEIRKAHVICVVYAIDNPNSFDRIPTYWLPHFRQLGVNVPVILVGNKIDLRGGEVTNEALEDEIIPIMNEFKASFLPSSLA
ncbi:hypothetical protein J3R82DRAFT_9643 [Butyriboletus roseoflavus]|nr:hypothetical protein J3R82DRAFT_9643 [Butyriboletus roseoflavus]